MAEDRGNLLAVVRRVMNLRVRYWAPNFLTSSVTIRRKNSTPWGECVVTEMACVDMGVSGSESCDMAGVGIGSP
jgi:hypothetical protein